MFRKAHPVLLDIFCRGVQVAERRSLVLAAMFSIAASPLSLPFIVLKKGIHLTILLVAWWFLRDFFMQLKSLDYVLLVLGVVVVLYKDIYCLLQNILLNVLVIVTAGSFLRWVCAGYLSGTAVRQKLLTIRPMQEIIATSVPALPVQYSARYDRILDLYLGSNIVDNEKELVRILEEYS